MLRLLLLLSFVIAEAAAAQNATLVSVTGPCSLNVAGSRQKCSSVIYMHAPATGRSSFNVPTELGAIAFSGANDLQPNLNLYILNVDSILNGRGDGSSVRSPASGRCELKGSDDGSIVHSISCEAMTEFGTMRLELRGNGRPVKRLS